MYKIAIISGSVRTNRQSHKLALYFKNYIVENKLGEVELLDLKAYNFPLVEERIIHQKNPPANQLEFAGKINNAHGVILVTPEYNGGYPASVKNAIDMLVKEWHHKPVGIVTVSNGEFGGVNANAFLQNVLLKIKAIPIMANFRVPKVQDNYNDEGVPINKEITDKNAKIFLDELMVFIEAFGRKS
ncbi:MAG TPA: NAD(P)H-dependent oxidoreductase [Saprospiraceae bacterium]|nr:NAD(P)H-dependent oxidoreductase [Saprospiraceae bacterium]